MVPQPPPPSSNAKNILQFLSTALSRGGSEELPYSKDVKWLIRQHLLALSGAYPSLQPKTGTLTHNDGRVVHLLHTDGTVPMVYQGVTYNIPIVIWLMETYPRYPPKVFVNPTRDMIIRRQHPFVNPNGNVSVPYLQNWVYPSSNLLDLARELSQLFSSDPPLYSQQRRNPTPNPNPSPSPATTSSNYGSSTVSGNISVRPAIPPRTYPPSPYGMAAGGGITNAVRFPSPALPQTVEDAGEVFRRNAINKLVENLHNDIEGLRKTREAEMDGLFTAQAALRQREEQLSLGLREMHDEKEGLEQQLQMILMNADVLEGWVRENEGKKVTDARNMNVDDAFEPSDALSKQMLDCTSTDLSIEDVVYSLDIAVQEGSIPFDQYLRNVRLLSSEQFFHRATAAKVRAVQMQAHVTSMASRASPYGG